MQTNHNSSAIRRKPQFTYQSPEPGDHLFFTLRFSSRSKPTPSTSNRSRTPPSSEPKASQPNPNSKPSVSHRYPMPPPLPLFHPLGRLAMSLPPLDPTAYGLPIPPNPDINDKRASSRSHRPPSVPQEADDATPTVSSIAAVAAREVKERPSPRKRRVGAAKRKRKDVDDGDATYPAKRTRIPRGATNQVDDDSPTEVAPANDFPPISEPADLAESSKRRSARSRGGTRRRDSSASEATSVSASVHVNPAHSSVPGTETLSSQTEANTTDTQSIAPPDQSTNHDDKEDGELSEELVNP